MRHLPNSLSLLFIICIMAACQKSFDNSGGSGTTPVPAPVLTSVTTVSGVLSGPKNTIITLRGSNFITDLNKISITVNGKPCEILSAASDSIKAKIPAKCGTGSILLNMNGTLLNGPVFTYIFTYTLQSITNGLTGYQDGPIANALWDEISGLCVDTSNNIYTSQYSKPVIRKINSAYTTVSTLAGDRTVGDLNGQGTGAKLGWCDNISVDDNGNIYYADQSNSKIKKISSTGAVTTLISGLSVVPVTAQVAKSGNIYVLSFDSSISKYNAAGVLQWKIKSHGGGSLDGDSSVVKFMGFSFGNVAIDDAEQNLYFSCYEILSSAHPSQVKKLNLSTLVTSTLAGSATVAGATDGPAAGATFKLICGLALDSLGGLYIADGYNDKIRYLYNGNVSTIIGAAGSGDVDGDVSTAKIQYPDGLRMNRRGELIIACVTNKKIKRLIID